MQDINLSKLQRNELIALCEELKIKSPEDAIAINNIIQFIRDQKYGLSFEKHQEQVDADLITKIPVFVEDESKRVSLATSSDGPTPYNFLLEGDNLHSLKLLEKTHKGAIDVIYIDPPYNTGNEFIYNDKIVGKDDGYRHSKWLSFMRERLNIAHNLLSDDGLIFISIDDREQANLKLLCDGIFGEENYLNTIIWNKNSTTVMLNKEGFSSNTEFILLYKKDKSIKLKNNAITEKLRKSYNKDDNDGKGPYRTTSLYTNTNGNKKTTLLMPDGSTYEAQWQVTQETLNKYVEQGLIVKTSSGWRKKIYLSNCDGSVPVTLLDMDTVGTTKNGTNEIKSIFGKPSFSYPKPTTLIKYIIDRHPRKNITVLDFFAGSGTTGQAVLEINKEDGGKRKFILCTNNENNICEEVTYQRLKTVITGTRVNGSKYSDGIPANIKYFKAEMIERNDDDLDEKLLDASIPLIELENFEDIKDTNSSVFIAYSDEDLDDFEAEFDITTNRIKTIYIAEDVCMSESQEQLFEFNEIKVKTIPNNYFREM